MKYIVAAGPRSTPGRRVARKVCDFLPQPPLRHIRHVRHQGTGFYPRSHQHELERSLDIRSRGQPKASHRMRDSLEHGQRHGAHRGQRRSTTTAPPPFIAWQQVWLLCVRDVKGRHDGSLGRVGAVDRQSNRCALSMPHQTTHQMQVRKTRLHKNIC